MHRASLFLVVAALVLGALTSVAAAQGDAVPAEPVAVERQPFLAQESPARLPDSVQFKGGQLIASVQETPLWTLTVMASPANEKNPDFTALAGPWVQGRYVYYCLANNLYRTHLSVGTVNARAVMPGQCVELTHEGEALKLSLKGGQGRWTWTKTIEVNDATFEATRVELSDHMGRMALRRQASASAHGVKLPSREDQERWDAYLKRAYSPLKPEIKDAIEGHISWLKAQHERDPTNPWLLYERGLMETYLGAPDQAAKSFEALLHWDGQHKEELLAMVLQLDEIDVELGQRAFELGLRSMLERGYDPDFSSSLVALMIFYGRPHQLAKLDEVVSDDALYMSLSRHADRLALVAPKVEGIVYFWSAMHRAATARKDAAGAARYAKLEQDAQAYRYFGVGGQAIEFTGDWINLYIAAVLSLLMLFVIKMLRTFSARYRAKDGEVSAALKFNLLTRWSYPELVGTIFVVPLIMYFGQKAAQGVMIMGIIASAPVEVVSSDMGSPTALKYIQELKSELPDVKYIQAVSYQQAGQYDQAQALYEQVGNAASVNNLGVIRFNQGKPDEATALFEQAAGLSSSAIEPAHNLGRELPHKDSSRARRIERFKLKGKLLMPPTPKQWERFWKARIALSDEDPSSVNALPRLWALVAGSSASDGFSVVGILGGLVSLILLVLGIAAMVTPRGESVLEAPKYGQLGWLLGVIIPGTSKQYHVLGPFVCILFNTSVLCAIMLSNTKGAFTSILDSIAVPSFSRYFGLSAPYEHAQTFFHTLGHWWWVLLLAHFIFIGVMEWLRPDDSGLVAKLRRTK